MAGLAKSFHQYNNYWYCYRFCYYCFNYERERKSEFESYFIILIDFAEHTNLLKVVNSGSYALATGQISSKLLELLEIFRSFG